MEVESSDFYFLNFCWSKVKLFTGGSSDSF